MSASIYTPDMPVLAMDFLLNHMDFLLKLLYETFFPSQWIICSERFLHLSTLRVLLFYYESHSIWIVEVQTNKEMV